VGGNPAITNEISQAYSGSNQGNGSLLLAPYQGSSKPSAFLNYILFDEEYKVIEAKSAPVGSANVVHQVTLPTVQVKELGYLFVYLSYDNESAHWVHFDELKITHTESPVLQVNAYYPFGMMAYTWLRDGEKENLYGYQGKEYDSLTRWHDFHARQYDGALGRWFAVDPQDQFASPYLAMGDNPVMMVDPDGEFAIAPFLITAFKIYQYASAAYNVYKAYQEGGLIGAGRALTMAGFMWAFGQASNMLAGQLASSVGLNNSSVGEIVGRNLFTAAFNVGTIAGLTGLMGGDVRKSITSSAPYALTAATLVTSAEIDDYKLRWRDISPTPGRVFLPEVVITAKRLGNTDQPIPGTGEFDPLPDWWGHPSYLSSFNNNIRAAQGAWAPFAMTLVTAPLSLMSGGGAVLSRGSNAAKGVVQAEKASGSYLLQFQSGKFYAGKGLQPRMMQSINRIETTYGDKLLNSQFFPASSTREALINEHNLMMQFGGPKSFNPLSPTYNKIFSPGRKLRGFRYGKRN